MADKKKRTDEEWAQLVADKVAETTQRMGQEARIALGTEPVVTANDDVRIDTVDAAGRSRLEAKQAEVPVYKAETTTTPLPEGWNKPVKAETTTSPMESTPAERAATSMSKGAVAATDQELAQAILEQVKPVAEGKSGGKGGGFLSNIKQSLGAMMTQAAPGGAGGGGGYESPDARGQSIGQAVTDPIGSATRAVSSSVQSMASPGNAAPVFTQPAPAYSTALGAAQAGQLGVDMGGAGGGGGSNGPLQTGAQGNSGVQMPGEPTIGNPLPAGLKVAGAGVGSFLSGQPWNPAEVFSNALSPQPMAPTPLQPQARPPTGGGGGLSASMSGPIGTAPGFPKTPDLSPGINADVKTQQDAMLAQAEGQAQFERERAGILDQQQADIQARQARQQETTEFVNARAKELFDTTAEAQKILNTPAQTPDPERYWKSHNKIMFAIGVGLLTQAKADVGSVLNSVSAAIDRDIEAQKAEFEAPRTAARSKVQGAQTLYGMLRNMGHDAYEAEKTAGSLSDEFYAKQYEKLAANTNSELVKQRALEESGKLGQSAKEKMQDALLHRASVGVQEYNARTNRMDTNVKISAQTGGPGRKLTEAERKVMQHNRDAIIAIRKIKEVLGPPQSFAGAAKDSAMKSVPYVMTDAKERSRSVEAAKTILATDLAKSSLQAHEQTRWLGEGGLLGGVGLDNQSQRSLDELESLLLRGYDATQMGEIPGGTVLPPTAQRVR